jgi:acetyl-CoA carboxylase biotin carboxylase subunit
MRAVRNDAELESAYPTAQAEAEANFRDGRLYMEKLLEHPRHVEVQILGDTFGTVVHLGERDCSVQKPSHQKLIEESPAPHLSPELRARLHEMAIAAGMAVDYTSAGTIEFLVCGDDIYFMEMNTRIQVEHPVTEMLYRVDLVGEQLRIAAGERTSLAQSSLKARGHVIECRINAENAQTFAPSAGRLENVVFPGGPGVRVDTYVRSGFMVPPYYDSMLAKLIVHADSRDAAIDRMDAALRDTRITGLNTTVDMCRRIIGDPAFRAGGVDVEFLPGLMERSNAIA